MIQYVWKHSSGGRPYVRLRNDAGEMVSVMWFQRKHVFRVFLNHMRRPFRADQPKIDCKTIEEAFAMARGALDPDFVVQRFTLACDSR